MPENIKWLFFDIGSTLIDESVAYEHRLREIAHQADVPFEKVYETALSFYKKNKTGDHEAAKAFGIPLTKWHKEEEILYDDTIYCLETLSKKYKIGVIANQSLGSKERLEQKGILKYIDLVIASAEESVAKPDPKIFELALERSGCKAENAVMIGDRIDNDIVPAKKLGMKTVWVKQGFHQYWNIENDNEKPDFSVSSLTELCSIDFFQKMI